MASVERLAQVLAQPFSTIPIVNRKGKLIGTIPKQFIIVLLEHHAFYEYSYVEVTKKIEQNGLKMRQSVSIEDTYTSAIQRKSTNQLLKLSFEGNSNEQ